MATPKIFKRVPIRRAAVLAAVAAGALAPAASAAGVSVSPASGALGTRFKISFVTPKAEPAGFYRVKAHASKSSGSCVSSIAFTNPKAVVANSHVRFSFVPTAAEELCDGAWTVRVNDPLGGALLSGGSFTIGSGSSSTPTKKPKPTPTKPTPSKPTPTKAGAIKVTPTSGGAGTTFTIGFASPTTVAANGLQVRARASSTHGGSCVGTLNFSNPKPASAKTNVKFAFTATAVAELCNGAWTVDVLNSSGSVLLSGGSFTLS